MKKLQKRFLMNSCCALLLAIVTLSCTDHDIENPQTVCIRVDGSLRDLPCEFKIVKAEFMKGYMEEVIATATTERRKVTLSVSSAFVSIRPNTGFAELTYKVILYIKRVANPSYSSSNQYVIDYLTAYLPNLETTFSAYHFPPVYPPLPNNISTAVGGTFKIAVNASYHVKENFLPDGQPVYSDPSGAAAYLIYNMKTANILAGPPYSYANVLDLAESHIIFEPVFVP